MILNLFKMLFYLLIKNKKIVLILIIPLILIIYSSLKSESKITELGVDGLIIFAIYTISLYSFFFDKDQLLSRNEVLVGYGYDLVEINLCKSLIIAFISLASLITMLVVNLVHFKIMLPFELVINILLFISSLGVATIFIVNFVSYLHMKYGLIYQLRTLIMMLYLFLSYKVYHYLSLEISTFFIMYLMATSIFIVILIKISKKVNNEVKNYL